MEISEIAQDSVTIELSIEMRPLKLEIKFEGFQIQFETNFTSSN